jgi:hypothetical protein
MSEIALKSLVLAADARLTRTQYTDDQSWELLLGEGDSPSLSLQTRYGGRVGLASLTPMWVIDGRELHESARYAQPPRIADCFPGFARVEAMLTPEIALNAEYWVMDSAAIGVRFTLRNTGTHPVSVRFDLFAYVITESSAKHIALLALADGSHALSLGRFDRLQPVAVLENGAAGQAMGGRVSPKIGLDLALTPGGSRSVRWVAAGSGTMGESLTRAQQWLERDWESAFEAIAQAGAVIPQIETGDPEADGVIRRSYHDLMQAFLSPDGSFAHATLTAARHPGRGFSRSGDGLDYDRAWNGQSAHLAYLTALAAGPVDARLAQGLVRNFIAVQHTDGWIDLRPGLAGQRAELMCPPLLARLTWQLYELTGDSAFLKETFSPLLKFFKRWFGADFDEGADGIPQWQDERQTGYVSWPIVAPWGQGADIRTLESPDLVAYLLSEAYSLRQIAEALGDAIARSSIDPRINQLQTTLAQMAYEARYAYRDRTTHLTAPAVSVITDGRADEEHILALRLPTPARLVVRLSGGMGKAPRALMTLEGLDADGNAVKEAADASEFEWRYGGGIFTSRRVFAQIDRIHTEGLSRVFRLNVATVDTTTLDLNAVLPLWAGGVPEDRVAALVALITDPSHFWRSSGLTMISAQDDHYDPTSANGGGGVWPYWVTLIGEALIDAGAHPHAVELVRRLLRVQAAVLRETGSFKEFYHSDQAKGLGEDHYLGGIAPLALLNRLIGAAILSPGRVMAGGVFAWGQPVTVRAHGVTVRRSDQGTTIAFPSGHQVNLPPDAPFAAVIDPQGAPPASVTNLSLSVPSTSSGDSRVIITIDPDPA